MPHAAVVAGCVVAGLATAVALEVTFFRPWREQQWEAGHGGNFGQVWTESWRENMARLKRARDGGQSEIDEDTRQVLEEIEAFEMAAREEDSMKRRYTKEMGKTEESGTSSSLREAADGRKLRHRGQQDRQGDSNAFHVIPEGQLVDSVSEQDQVDQSTSHTSSMFESLQNSASTIHSPTQVTQDAELAVQRDYSTATASEASDGLQSPPGWSESGSRRTISDAGQSDWDEALVSPPKSESGESWERLSDDETDEEDLQNSRTR